MRVLCVFFVVGYLYTCKWLQVASVGSERNQESSGKLKKEEDEKVCPKIDPIQTRRSDHLTEETKGDPTNKPKLKKTL